MPSGLGLAQQYFNSRRFHSKKLHLMFQLITKRTLIAKDVAPFLPNITVTYKSKLFLNRCISRSRYLGLNIMVAI